MRTLNFEPGSSRYGTFWSCLTMLPTSLGGMPIFSLAQGEVDDHVSMVRKFKAIGQCINPKRAASESAVYECVAGGTLALENSEYALLSRMTDAAVPVINIGRSEEYQDARDWLRKLPIDAPMETA